MKKLILVLILGGMMTGGCAYTRIGVSKDILAHESEVYKQRQFKQADKAPRITENLADVAQDIEAEGLTWLQKKKLELYNATLEAFGPAR